ncbi:MAG TPA: hypothetical protein PLC38_00685 [Methanobacterium sp.]|jgi:hypothetical protein|nr:hypothetical protein [Methanobacterium sp.]
MGNYKAMCITVKCEECGHDNAQLLPLEISKENWMKTQKMHGEMVIEDFK